MVRSAEISQPRLYPRFDADASSTILMISARRSESSICRNAFTSVRPSAGDGGFLALARACRKDDSMKSLASAILTRPNRDIAGNGCERERTIKVGRWRADVKTQCYMAPS